MKVKETVGCRCCGQHEKGWCLKIRTVRVRRRESGGLQAQWRPDVPTLTMVVGMTWEGDVKVEGFKIERFFVKKKKKN